MNRSVWTGIQLAASLVNAAFLVVSHVPSVRSATETASVFVGRAAARVQPHCAQRLIASVRQGPL